LAVRGRQQSRRSARPRLLVLRALGLGDLLTAVPSLRGLARSFPDHRRILAAPAALAPLLDLISDGRGQPVVERVLDAHPLAPLPSELARVSVAVNLHGRGPQSHRLLLALSPHRLIGFANPQVPRSRPGPQWIAGEHEVRRWCRMLSESDVTCDPGALDIERPDPSEGSLPCFAENATLLHPGAARRARRWPLDRWSKLARAEQQAGRPVLISGSSAEVELAERIARQAGLSRGAVLAGRTNLRELAGAVAAAGRVVCGDTGVGHLATALGTPSVLLFGPVAPREWGPPPQRPWHRVLWKGRRGDPHADTIHEGLLQIGVGEVVEALRELEQLTPAAIRMVRTRSSGEAAQLALQGGAHRAARGQEPRCPHEAPG
jgi:ADP-heptose:LPS heptosyltransferase